MTTYGMTEPQAFKWIQRTAMDHRMTMREVAERILAETAGGEVRRLTAGALTARRRRVAADGGMMLGVRSPCWLAALSRLCGLSPPATGPRRDRSGRRWQPVVLPDTARCRRVGPVLRDADRLRRPVVRGRAAWSIRPARPARPPGRSPDGHVRWAPVPIGAASTLLRPTARALRGGLPGRPARGGRREERRRARQSPDRHLAAGAGRHAARGDGAVRAVRRAGARSSVARMAARAAAAG